jgi:hypothetical protein
MRKVDVEGMIRAFFKHNKKNLREFNTQRTKNLLDSFLFDSFDQILFGFLNYCTMKKSLKLKKKDKISNSTIEFLLEYYPKNV